MNTNVSNQTGTVENLSIAELSRMDRASNLHPFTPLRAFEADEIGGPRIVESGQGIRITDAEGKTSIDGFAGLYCVNIGYGRTEVADASPKAEKHWRKVMAMLSEQIEF